MSANVMPYYLANKPVYANQNVEVLDKHSGKIAWRVARADAITVDQAIDAASRAARPMATLPAYKRRDVLLYCAERFRQRQDELIEVLIVEGGKVLRDAKGEVTRLIETFAVAAEEATRIGGEVMPMDISPRAERYTGMWKRVPLGPVSFITPFNFPYNLVAHKIAPAIAAGCPFVLKPAEKTPLGALLIGETLAECDLPEGAFSIFCTSRDDARALTEDDRLKLMSFTGSDLVGWQLKRLAGKKPVVMELGGNAACLIDHDTDIEDAVTRVVFGGYYQSGQSCVSVQRVMVHDSLYEAFRDRLCQAVGTLPGGDPRDQNTWVGPLITEDDAKRVVAWIEEAVNGGGKLLVGGERHGSIVRPAIVEDAPATCRLRTEEVFGPVMTLERFHDFDAALDDINSSRYGLQAGIFIRDIGKINKAWHQLDVGGVIINDVPSFRVDHMPYGGTKDSGLGREGIRFSIEDLTQIRLLAIRDI